MCDRETERRGEKEWRERREKRVERKSRRRGERETVWLMCKELAGRRQKTPLRTSDQKSEQKKSFSNNFFLEQASENASCNWPLFLSAVRIEDESFSKFAKSSKKSKDQSFSKFTKTSKPDFSYKSVLKIHDELKDVRKGMVIEND